MCRNGGRGSRPYKFLHIYIPQCLSLPSRLLDSDFYVLLIPMYVGEKWRF